MRPDVARLGVNAADGLETFDGGQRGSMSEMEEIIILQPLRQTAEVNDLKASMT